MENETKKFAYNISQWITLYRFLLEHFNYEKACEKISQLENETETLKENI